MIALRNAIAADPHFALAYTRLGDLLVSLGHYDGGYQAYHTALAEEQQQRLTRRERDGLRGIYASDAQDFPAAIAAFTDYTAYYPSDYLGWFYRAYPLMMMGHVEEAIASLKKAEAIDPQRMSAPAGIARYELLRGDFAETSRWIRYLRDKNHAVDADLIEGQSDFLVGAYQKAEAHFLGLTTSQDSLYRSYGYALLARLYAELGRYQDALQALAGGIDVDLEDGYVGFRADKLLDRAYIDFRLGHTTCA